MTEPATPLHCPDSGEVLIHQDTPAGSHWPCAACGGVAMAARTLVAEVTAGAADAVEALIGGRGSADGGTQSARPCPRCRRPMTAATVETEPPGGARVEACRSCALVWLEPAARDRLPLRLSADRAEELEREALSAGATLAVAPARCPSCGAPWEVVDSVQCRWCGAALLTARPLG